MKKLYISFILLLSFLAFIPQIAFADIPISLTPQQKREIEENNKKELNCLYEKKSKLPSEYTGDNIQPKEVGIDYKGGFVFKDEKSKNINLRNRRSWNERRKFLTTKISYSINPEENLSREFGFAGKYSVTSIVDRCIEYVVMREKSRNMFYSGYLYDVTNVPLGSHLKYVPETHEMQVISPLSKEYKQIIEEQMIPKKPLSEKAEEDFKKIPQNILIALCICMLVVIFVKEIIKKCKK